MSLSDVAAALAVRVAGEFKSLRAVLAGKADAGHKHAAGDITTGVLPAARGGTNSGSIGPSGSLAYSDGSRIAYTAAVGGAMVLESGDSIGDPPQWGSRLSRHSTQVVGAEPNDFLLNGWRFFSSGTVDLPTSDASYTISVLNNGSGPAASIEQRAIRWPDGMVFRRMRSNGVWGAWSRVHLTEEETDSRYDAAVRANAPSNPRPGQQWWDERNVVLKIWTGSRWQRVGEEVGAIKSFYGTVAQVPDGYLACRGQVFDATTYTDLVDFLGTNVVPDLRDLMLRGQSGTGAPGAVAGVAGDEVTLAVGNLPSHTHGNGTLTAASAGAHTHEVGYSTGDGGNSNYKRTGVASGTFGYNRAGINSDGAHTHNVTGTTGATGSGNAFSVLNRNQPVHFIIKT